MERTIEVHTETAAALERVGDVVQRDPAAIFAEPDAPRPTPRSWVVTLSADLVGGAGATHEAVLEVQPATVETDGVRWPLRWRPSTHGKALPAFEGTLRATPATSGTLLCLSGTYRPPLGPVGAFGDGVIGHRLARSTAHILLADITKRIEARLAADLAVGGIRPAPYPPDLRDPLPRLSDSTA